MINQAAFLEILQNVGIDFFTGVPDVYLSGFTNYLQSRVPKERHVTAINEENAVAIAIGYYVSTGKLPLVYMKDMGIGINWYRMPMLLLAGWRNGNGYERQGHIVPNIAELLDIPWHIAADDCRFMEKLIKRSADYAMENKCPVLILVPNGVLTLEKIINMPTDNGYTLSRSDAIEAVLNALPVNTVCTASEGNISGELYLFREKHGGDHDLDFLNTKMCGCASSTALSIALNSKDRYSVCLDGDGATLMQMGMMSIISKYDVPNFMHILLNNGAYESTGGITSYGMTVDFTAIAKGCGYITPDTFLTCKDEISDAVCNLSKCGHPVFIEVRIKQCSLRAPQVSSDSQTCMLKSLMDRLQRK